MTFTAKHAETLAAVYHKWVAAKSERQFEKWLRTQIIRTSQHVAIQTRHRMLRPSASVSSREGATTK